MTRAKGLLAICCFTVLGLGGAYFYGITPHHSFAPPDSPQALLDRADTLSWGNKWVEARPLYARAQKLYTAQGQPAKALYAEASQAVPNESISVEGKILRLTQDLSRPEAQDPETKLRILTIRGMLETNFDAAEARATWVQVAQMASQQHHYELATRAGGEQGIAAFLLGNIDVAKKKVVTALTLRR